MGGFEEIRRCEGCGREFRPRRSGHWLCDRCYWRRRRLQAVHGRLWWLDRPGWVLGVMAVGVLIAWLLSRW